MQVKVIMRIWVLFILFFSESVRGMKKNNTIRELSKKFNVVPNSTFILNRKFNIPYFFNVQTSDRFFNPLQKREIHGKSTVNYGNVSNTKIKNIDKNNSSFKKSSGFAKTLFDQRQREYSTKRFDSGSEQLSEDPNKGKNLKDLFNGLNEVDAKKLYRNLAKIYNTDNGSYPSKEQMQELNSIMERFSNKPQPENNPRSYKYSPEQSLGYDPTKMSKKQFGEAFKKVFLESGFNRLGELYHFFIEILTDFGNDTQYLAMEEAINEVVKNVVNPSLIENLSKECKNIYNNLLDFEKCEQPCYTPFPINLNDGSRIFLPREFIKKYWLTPYRFRVINTAVVIASKIDFLQKHNLKFDKDIFENLYENLVTTIALRSGISNVNNYNEEFKTYLHGYFKYKSVDEVVVMLTRCLNEYENLIKNADFDSSSNRTCQTHDNMGKRDAPFIVYRDLFGILYYEYLLKYLESEKNEMYNASLLINFKLYIDRLKKDKQLLTKLAQDVFDYQQKDSSFRDAPAKKKWFGIF